MSDVDQNLLDVLETAMPVSTRHIIHRLRDVGRDTDMRTALVGGVPRELIRVQRGQLPVERLFEELRDIDVVVEGDAIAFTKRLHSRLPGRIVGNEAFRTATLTLDDGVILDIATARTEEYDTPGSLPAVSTAGTSLNQDMARRDFTINAMALDVSDSPGELIDPTGGRGDVADKLVRVLHPRSFIDDPTRLARALRYSIRFEYNLEPATRALYTAAVDEAVTDHLTPERIRYELECIGREERWAEIWAVMDLTRLTRSLTRELSAISRDWQLEDAAAFDVGLSNQRELAETEGLEFWLLRTAWVLRSVGRDDLQRAMERIGLFPRHQRWIAGSRQVLREAVPRLPTARRPSEICKLLERYPRQAVLFAVFLYAPKTEDGVAARKYLLRYLTEFGAVRSELSGDDLLAMGFSPGPLLGQVRDELRYSRLDGVIKDVETEREYALAFLTPGAGEPGAAGQQGGDQPDDALGGDADG